MACDCSLESEQRRFLIWKSSQIAGRFADLQDENQQIMDGQSTSNCVNVDETNASKTDSRQAVWLVIPFPKAASQPRTASLRRPGD